VPAAQLLFQQPLGHCSSWPWTPKRPVLTSSLLNASEFIPEAAAVAGHQLLHERSASAGEALWAWDGAAAVTHA